MLKEGLRSMGLLGQIILINARQTLLRSFDSENLLKDVKNLKVQKKNMVCFLVSELKKFCFYAPEFMLENFILRLKEVPC